ncbi:hypothetical protein F4861DRAFT_495814 [Xylaria intraflava]|nr:hypothetical protein F4861DRAFT_495814 [Xylaria intraflava]
MTSATPLQLEAILAIPAALRSVLILGTFASSRSRPQYILARQFSAYSRHYGRPKYPNVAAFVIPEFRTSPVADVTPDELFKSSSLLSAPGQPLEEELTKLYTKNPATFIYAESDFYKLRKNTRIPEVCVLGRSNVGKSSFVNALAHRPNNRLAYVSSKAGKTRSINTYGFGPAPTIKELQAQGDKYKDEDIPAHAFYLVDMPGYGHASLKEWGKNISLYMNKRNGAKGAIVLIDAEVGPKDSDYHLLQLLSTTRLKTAIVLTKADKVKKGLEGLRETCRKVWDGIHAIEARATGSEWVWDKDIYVTAVGANDSAVLKSTATTARLAVARLAGLTKEERPNMERNQRWAGKMISFDDLQYARSEPDASKAGSGDKKINKLLEEAIPPPRIVHSQPTSISAFDNFERATEMQHSGRFRNSNASSTSQTGTKFNRAYVRKFHSSPIHISEPPHNKLTADELKAVFDSFVKSLKADTARDWVRRLQQERERQPQRIFRTSFQKIRERQLRRLQRRFPEQTARIQIILKRRLEIEERRGRLRAIREAEAKAAVGVREWSDVDDAESHEKDTDYSEPPSDFEKEFKKRKDPYETRGNQFEERGESFGEQDDSFGGYILGHAQ